MARHKPYQPRGIIPAVLLPFDADRAIDEVGLLDAKTGRHAA
jgi:hypothetical protein